MKSLLLAFASLFIAATAHAQWKTTTYTLKGGWNAIYLSGDATYDTIDALMPSTVLEIWRWNPNPNQVGFIDTPLIPSSGTAEWSVWKRGLPAESNLTQLSGQTAYLVKCSGNATQTYPVGLKQSPRMPTNSWVRNGANLLGFPSLKNGSTYPTMASYFATFPAAIAAGSKVYKYVGGDLGAGNPLQVFSPSSERLDSTQAYWFSAEVTGNYYAPLELSLSTSDGGLSFGRTGSTVTLRLRNRSAAAATVTFTPTTSESAPATQTPVAGPVALTRRTFNAVLGSWTETALSGASTLAVGANSTVELSFGIDRSGMTGAADAFYASLLRITESSNLMDVDLPVSAKKASLAGLWVGDISLNSVSSKVSNRAQATATLSNGTVSALSVNGSGGSGYTSAPTVTISAPASNGNSIATAAAARSATGTITALTATKVGGGYTSAPTVTIAAPTASVAAAATASFGGGGVTSIAVNTAGLNYFSAPTITIPAPPASGRATANATVTSGAVTAFTITSGGSNYSLVSPNTVPAVTFTGGTTTATATASLGLTLNNFTISSGTQVYSAAPTVAITGGGATTAATATAVLTAGRVTAITLTNGGIGFTSVPTLTFSGGTVSTAGTAPSAVVNGSHFNVVRVTVNTGGAGYTTATVSIAPPPAAVTATATASVNAAGAITGITVTNPGTGYNSAPTIPVPAPPAAVQATATAVLTNGTVSGYTITNPGSGYSDTDSATYQPLPGVRYDYYEGTWTALPDFNTLTPVRSGVTDTFNLDGRLRDDNFAMRFRATLSTPVAGSYTFYTSSDDGSRLLVDGTVVVNNDGLHANVEQQGTVTLTAGVHEIEVQYLEFAGSEVLVASYAPPGLPRQVIPSSVLPVPPSVTVGSPPMNQRATAIATLSGGSVSGLTLTSGGSGYTLTPSVTLEAPPALTGTAASGTYSMRTLLHVSDNGTARLLSKVYLGRLAAGSNDFGICTSQALLHTASLASARRLSSVHLPFGQVITGSGTVAPGSQLSCTITLPYTDPTNPFVHQFHPDHDNRNATFNATLSEGVESYTVTRVGTFSFTATPPAGSTVTSGWGSSVIGGTYSEILSGLHSGSIQLGGTFELRRASELGTLSE